MIVTPPSGICAIAPSSAPSADQRAREESPATFRAASQIASAKAIPTTATSRLLNSMIACWLPSVGNGASRSAASGRSPGPRQ